MPPDYGVDPPTLSTTPDAPQVRVTVGATNLYPRANLSVTPETPVYLAFGVRVSIHRHHGLESAPVAGAFSEYLERFWRSNCGSAVKIVVWLAECARQNPVAPHPHTGADNEVLIQDSIFANLNELPDSQQSIQIGGVYIYKFQKVPALTDPLFIGKSPFNVQAARSFSYSEMSRSIIGPALNPAGFTGGAINY